MRGPNDVARESTELPAQCPPIVAFSISYGVASQHMSRIARVYLKYRRFQLGLICPLLQTAMALIAIIPLWWVLTYG